MRQTIIHNCILEDGLNQKNSLIKQEVVKRDLEIDFDSDYKNIEFDIVTE